VVGSVTLPWSFPPRSDDRELRMTLPLCPHCDCPLRPEDLADGWCDACGKRLPSRLAAGTIRPASRPLPVKPPPAELPLGQKTRQPDRSILAAGEHWLRSRPATLVLLAAAFACFLLPWTSVREAVGRFEGDGPGPTVEASQSGLQMASGGASTHVEGDARGSLYDRPREILQRRQLSPPLFWYPLCLLLAAGATLLLAEPSRRRLWVGVWAGQACLVLALSPFPWLSRGSLWSLRVLPWFWACLAATFSVLLQLAWPTRRPGVAASTGEAAARFGLLACVATAYAVAFFLPAATLHSEFRLEDGRLISASGQSIVEHDLTGHEAFAATLVGGDQSWRANPFLWAGGLLLVAGRWLWAAGGAVVALLLGLTVPLHARWPSRRTSTGLGTGSGWGAWSSWRWAAWPAGCGGGSERLVCRAEPCCRRATPTRDAAAGT